MEILKVVSLKEEVETIIAVGKMLREISNGLADGSIDKLSDETANLLKAVKEVLDTIISE